MLYGRLPGDLLMLRPHFFLGELRFTPRLRSPADYKIRILSLSDLSDLLVLIMPVWSAKYSRLLKNVKASDPGHKNLFTKILVWKNWNPISQPIPGKTRLLEITKPHIVRNLKFSREKTNLVNAHSCMKKCSPVNNLIFPLGSLTQME